METIQKKHHTKLVSSDTSSSFFKVPPVLKNLSINSIRKDFFLTDRCRRDNSALVAGKLYDKYDESEENELKLYYSAIFNVKLSRLNQKCLQQEEEIERLRLELSKRESEIERITKDKDILQDRLDCKEKEFEVFKKSNSKEAVLLNTSRVFVDLVETELNCSICNEVIVKASICNPCGHVFCCACVTRWSKQKGECAVCRSPTKTRLPCKMLDSFIDALMKVIPDKEYRMERQKICEERRVQEGNVLNNTI